MCSSATQTILEDIITEKVNAGEMFTAFDISILAKKRAGVQDRHRDMRHVTHNFFTSGNMPTDYTRTLLDVGAPEQAFVYHRTVDDPRNYGKPAAKHSKKQQATPVASTPPTTTATPVGPSLSVGSVSASPGTPCGDDEAKADARLTVCLPKSILQQAGLNPGDTALVFADSGTKSIVVTKTATDGPSTYTKMRQYTVDYHGNVRITNFIFEVAGIKLTTKGDKVKVKGETTKVVVESA